MKIEDPMSTLKHERPVIDRRETESDRSVADGFGDRVYWLATRLWFGFGLAFVCAVIALFCVYGNPGVSYSRDYSRAIVPGAAALAFGIVGASAAIVRRDPSHGGTGQK